MLNKVLIGTIVNAILQALNIFVPGIELPDGLAEGLIVIIVFIAQFFTKETAMTVAKLVVK
jgi:hypothetical protein